MPIARVQMQDGRIARFEVPEGMEPQDIEALATQHNPKPEQANPGFVENVKDDWNKRLESYKQSKLATERGEQAPARRAWQGITNVMGAANDVVAEGASSLGKAAYDRFTTEGFKQRQNMGLQALAQEPTGKYIIGLGQKMAENKAAFEREYPHAARDVAGLGDFGAFVMPGGTGSIIKNSPKIIREAANLPMQVGKAASRGGADIGMDIVGAEKPLPLPSIKDMDDLTTTLYKKSADEGGVAPDLGNKFVEVAGTIKPLTEKGEIIRGKNQVQDVLDSIKNYKDKPFTMQEIEDVDKELTRKITNFLDNGRATPESRDIQELQNKFRDLVDAEEVTGVESWKDAKNAFSTKRKLQDIRAIYDNAKNRPNEATAIQAGFRRIAEDDARLRGFSPEARQYIVAAARQNNSADVLKLMGSRLLPLIVGGSGGGIGSAALTAAGGMAARNVAAKIAAGKGGRVEQQIIRDFTKKNSGKLSPREAIEELNRMEELKRVNQ